MGPPTPSNDRRREHKKIPALGTTRGREAFRLVAYRLAVRLPKVGMIT